MNAPHRVRSTSRREFLKLSGRTAASAALMAGLAPGLYAGAGGPIKLALVGCGGRGTGAVADAFTATGGPVKLYAVADLFEDRVQSSLQNLNEIAADKVDVPPGRRFVGFDAYKKAIDCLSPGDVVILATHAAFRPMHFEYAVGRGVNVFAEKSFATDAPAARRWLKAAELSEQKGLKVGVGFMWRHSQARQETIQRIHDGAIGDVHTLRIYRVHGPVQCPPLPEGTNELVFQLRYPNSFTWVSSGFYIDWHCHNIDVACWTKGAWPVSAQGMGGRCFEEAGSQFDHYTVEYTFADGTKLFTFSRHMHNCWETYADYAHGSKGSAVLMATLGEPRPKIYKGHQQTRENVLWEFAGRDPNPYVVEWQRLLDAIRQDKPHNEARRAGEAEIAALMGRMATHSGQLITWDQVMNSPFQFVADIDRMTFDTPAPIHAGPDGRYAPPQPGITNEC
ncbi:MAG: Gfo/Idh/MocA family oxidoreductase [Sedimentisphaerales bacterium]|jgi:predicted dehydrogenase|nr:Gfo/Idh/MocA family oxidoreductase [Planctomycetota bacterium]MDY0355562.1 Gfo/Idh/MocA family oxidoreductase [Sedimentisphaerales bacterium]NLT75850.1 Gfo/Idh/MocA family oxidoreductase [Planctomycetota bacterium]